MEGAPYVNPGTRRPYVSLGAEYEWRPWIATRVELATWQSSNTFLGGRIQQRFVGVPALIRLSPPRPLFHLRPFLLGGAALSTEVRCGGRASRPGIAVVTVDEYPRDPLNCGSIRTNLTDFALVAGGGLLVERGRLRWTAEVRRAAGQENLIHEYPQADPIYTKTATLLTGVSWQLR